METEQAVNVAFSKDDWDSLIHRYQRKTKSYRRRFIQEFDHELNSRLRNQVGLNCWLKCKHNWFRQTASIRDDKPYWRGSFACAHKKCLLQFDCFVQRVECQDLVVNMQVRWSGQSKHAEHRVQRQCRGEARKTMSLKAIALGVGRTQSHNIVRNRETGAIGMYDFC